MLNYSATAGIDKINLGKKELLWRVPCGRKTQQQAGSRVAKYLHRKKRSRESKLDGTLKAHTSDIFLPARKATSPKPPQRVSPTGDQAFK